MSREFVCQDNNYVKGREPEWDNHKSHILLNFQGGLDKVMVCWLHQPFIYNVPVMRLCVYVCVCVCVHVCMCLQVIELDGLSLTVEDLMRIGRGELRVKVTSVHISINTANTCCCFFFLESQISDSAVEAVKRSRKVVDDLVASNKGLTVKAYAHTHTQLSLVFFLAFYSDLWSHNWFWKICKCCHLKGENKVNIGYIVGQYLKEKLYVP